MDELVKRSGSQEGVQVDLAWEHSDPGGTAAEATRGALRLSLRGMVLWQGQEPGSGFSWTWVELLEFLAHAWPYLAMEEGFPFGLTPDDPGRTRAQAEVRWLNLPDPRREQEEEV